MGHRKKVLMITDVNFWLGGAGHRVRIAHLITYLSNNVRLTVFYVGLNSNYDFAAIKSKYQIDLICFNIDNSLEPFEIGGLLSKAVTDKQFDSIIVEYVHNTYYLNFIEVETHIILDTHDLINERTAEFEKYNYKDQELKLSLEKEIELLNIYDHVIAICEPDFQKIKSMIDPDKVILCPHPPALTNHVIRKKVETIGFIASEYLPNVDALEYFMSNCWDYLAQTFNVRLHVYGNINKVLDGKVNDGVFIKGFYEDIKNIYEEVDIVINPVRFGAGLKIKNIEAMANGKPLITSLHGSRGLEDGKERAFLVANSPEEYNRKIARLIQDFDFRKDLARHAHTFIKKNFAAEKCFRPLLNVINNSTNF